MIELYKEIFTEQIMQVLFAGLVILGLAFFQNVSFSLVSRSRNRDNMRYHVIASMLSNTIWFLTFRELIMGEMSLYLLPFYMAGTITGSVLGVKISMRIEKWLGATSDSHIKKDPIKELENRIQVLEKILTEV